MPEWILSPLPYGRLDKRTTHVDAILLWKNDMKFHYLFHYMSRKIPCNVSSNLAEDVMKCGV